MAAIDINDLLYLPQDVEVVEANLDRFNRALPGHESWCSIARVCLEFIEGRQYTEEERAALKEQGRPCLTLNKIAPLVRLMMGFNRQNRYDIKFMPTNDALSSQEIAELLTALSKQTDELNQSDWVDSEVFQDGISCGRGFWDTRLDFEKNRLGEIKEVSLDPFHVLVDDDAEGYAPRDWSFVMYNRWMSLNDIYQMAGAKALSNVFVKGSSLPLSNPNFEGQTDYETPITRFGMEEKIRLDFEYSRMVNSTKFGQHLIANRKLVRVLDCQHRVMKNVNYFVDFQTGMEKVIPDNWSREKIQNLLQFFEAKQVPIGIYTGLKKQVRWTITAADRILYDEWSPYDEFTITGYFPYFRRGITRGMVEDLIDPQKEINKRSSAFLHIIMTAANSGWIYEENSLSPDMVRALEEEGGRPGIHIAYKQGKPEPKKIQPSATPTNVERLVESQTQNLKEIAGINDSALGQIDRVQSGKAVIARQKQSILGAETYFDNFSRSRELKGVNRRFIYQTYYTEPRLIRSRASDGTLEDKWVNIKNAAGEIVNNITCGRYDTAVEEAPASATFMQSQFEEAMDLIEKGVPIPPDILIDLSSMPNKTEIKQRLKGDVLLKQTMERLQALGIKMQMGIPPEMPTPPVVSDGQNAVITPQQALEMQGAPSEQQIPSGNAGMAAPQQPALPAPAEAPMEGAPAPMPEGQMPAPAPQESAPADWQLQQGGGNWRKNGQSDMAEGMKMIGQALQSLAQTQQAIVQTLDRPKNAVYDDEGNFIRLE